MLKFLDTYTKITLSFALIVVAFLVSDIQVNFYIKLFLVILAYTLVAKNIVIGAFKTLIKRHRMSEEFLMTIATFGAFALNDLAEALAIIVFYKIGSIFEDYAQGRSHKEITSLLALKPSFVRIIKDDGSEEILKPRKVKIGSLQRVLAGESIALDGVLLSDSASLNMAALTGESEPVVFFKGDVVPSGAINLGKVIDIKTNVLSKDSSINRLIVLIEDASTNKSKPEALITRFSIYYTPIVISIAAALAIAPFIIQGLDVKDWVTRALVFLVLSCPCALVLSVPLSFFGGLGAISKIGVMVKGSIYIEMLSKIKAIAFDKTGTVTKGKFEVSDLKTINNANKDDLLFFIYNLERKTTHPIGRAISSYCKDQNVKEADFIDIEEISGFGIKGVFDNKKVFVGKADFIKDKVKNYESINFDNVGTEVYCALDDTLIGAMCLIDNLKDEALDFVASLHKDNIASYMITGDKEDVAKALAQKLNIKSFFAQMLPEDKLSCFKDIKKHNGVTAYVGDGINDAPVLACADVGIAMGQFGSAQAVEASDVVVMNDDLTKINKAIVLSKKTVALAMSNMILVIGVKFLILALGAFGFANIWLAIFGDVGLCILAVLNAMRALRFKS